MIYLTTPSTHLKRGSGFFSFIYMRAHVPASVQQNKTTKKKQIQLNYFYFAFKL